MECLRILLIERSNREKNFKQISCSLIHRPGAFVDVAVVYNYTQDVLSLTRRISRACNITVPLHLYSFVVGHRKIRRPDWCLTVKNLVMYVDLTEL